MSTKREHPPDTVHSQLPQDATVTAEVAQDTKARGGDAPETLRAPTVRSAVVVVPVPSSTSMPQAPSATRSPAPAQRDVHVAPNLRELVTAAPLATPQEAQAAKERRDLNEVVHSVLIIGLVISTALMLIGVGLDLFYQRDLPTAVPDIGEVISRVLVLRPSGFLALGLLVLIATPILRVVGSIGAFVYERDWRFAGITTLVLVVLVISLLLGHG
jgi:uncharacterized membrane protein